MRGGFVISEMANGVWWECDWRGEEGVKIGRKSVKKVLKGLYSFAKCIKSVIIRKNLAVLGGGGKLCYEIIWKLGKNVLTLYSISRIITKISKEKYGR